MVTLYYRGMAEDNGKPKIGRSARLLGIRPGIDIDVESVPNVWLDEQGYLKTDLEQGTQSTNLSTLLIVVIRNLKGMSVSLSIEGLPLHRKPGKFGGTGRDLLWQIDSERISGDLEAIQDGRTHVSIIPRATMLLERYESALAATQNDWQRVE